MSLLPPPALIEGKMDTVLGRVCVPLEGRFACIRRQETNLGNWVCDILLAATGADLVLLNSGTFRSDQVSRVCCLCSPETIVALQIDTVVF